MDSAAQTNTWLAAGQLILLPIVGMLIAAWVKVQMAKLEKKVDEGTQHSVVAAAQSTITNEVLGEQSNKTTPDDLKMRAKLLAVEMSRNGEQGLSDKG